MSPGAWGLKFLEITVSQPTHCMTTAELLLHKFIISKVLCTTIQLCLIGDIMRKMVFWLNIGLGFQESL